MRSYDLIKTEQDLRYLDFGERGATTGLRGHARKAREGSGADAVYYKLSSFEPATGRFGIECVQELIACRLAELLGIEHVAARPVHARIKLDGQEQSTWLLRMKSLRAKGERKLPFALFYQLERKRGEAPLELAHRLGCSAQVDRLLAFDYLIANAGRDASNVEVIESPNGTLRLAPLFSNGHSLLSTCSHREAKGRVLDALAPITAENCFGGTSLEDNLALIENPASVPKISADMRETLLNGLDAALPAADLEAIWAIIWTRGQRYARLCHL